ncbi:MAG: LacI family DNA-binding transcriptional regulator [Saccharothrix sp.]|nr:LacI family DNA-binding transcriptional regulator [Saccharothrix sp.]
MRRKRVTLADIAEAVGVSSTTVSLVLSGRARDLRISSDVQSRVRAAAERMGYRRGAVSAGPRAGRPPIIGFVSDTVATSRLAGEMIKGAVEAARDLGFTLVLGETEGDAALEHTLLRTLHQHHTAGVILASTRTRVVEVPEDLGATAAVLLNALPAQRSSLSSILPDEVEAGRAAARVLLEAGHRDGIHVIGAGPDPADVPDGAVAAVERLVGLHDEFDSAYVTVESARPCRSWLPESGFDATRDLLARTRPRALVCLDDHLALGACQALQHAGLRVPNDVSVVSFGDHPVSSWIRPRLTTVALPYRELGVKAVEVLVGDLRRPTGEAPDQGTAHRVPMPVRLRDSVGPPDDGPRLVEPGARRVVFGRAE